MRLLCLLGGLLLLLTASASAQDTGGVSGAVLETWNGTALPGVTVTVRGTTLAVQTDGNGRYELKNVPPGEQLLRFSKSGYATAVVTDVRVVPGQTSTVNGNLRPEFYEMEEYEVTAEEFTDTTTQILETRKDSAVLLEGVGADYLSRVGAGDAAEALGKVSGASVADGKYAVIRGLADRYTTTTLNGTDLPSADPDRKAAQLDLLPTQVIERMDVAKTFSPDMSGGFAGGSINIVTKDFPEKGTIGFSLGTSYNTQASLNKDFLVSDRSSTDWLAMDDGKRALPAVAAATSPRGTSGPIQNESAVEQSFGSSWLAPETDQAPLNSSFGLAFGDGYRIGDFRFGYVGSLGYKNDYKFYDNGIQRKYNSARGDLKYDKTDARGVSEYNWAASASLMLGWTENHDVKFNFLYVQSAEDEARQLQGVDDETETGSYIQQEVLHWTERNLQYYQLAGSHLFPEVNDIQLDWAGSVSMANQDEPDYRIFQFVATPSDSYYQPFGHSPPSYPTRFWRNVDEENQNVRGDLTVPVPSYNDKENSVKLGTALSDSHRDFFQRGFTMYPQSTANSFYSSGNPQDYLDPANYPYVQYRNFPVNVTYQGDQTITALYLMGDWATLNWLRFTGGARVEHTDLSLTGFNQSLNAPLAPGNISQDDVLPSLSATLSLRENLLLRAAWSETVVRPTYREIAPVAIYDVARARQYLGNPNLVISDSQNYDLRLEWFPRPTEILSASVFYKRISNPIEQAGEDTSNDIIRYFNYEKADVYGVELEARVQLDRLWDPLKEFTLGGNVAYIQSEVPLTAIQKQNRYLLYGATDETRPLYDQPDYVANVDLTWDHEATGTTFTIAGGVVGRRLVVVGLAVPDEYEEPAPQLDVFVSQKIGDYWKVRFSAKNLLDPAYESTQDWGSGGTKVVRSYTKGMTFGLSLGCEF